LWFLREHLGLALQAIAFYLLAVATVAAGLLVVSAKNPVHSVLFLITAFFSAAGLFVLMGAEFLAMLLIVVYVGAVAVLFLFVVMMLDVDFAELRQGFAQYLPIGGLVGGILTLEMIFVAATVATNGKAGLNAAAQRLAGRRAEHRGDRPGALHRLHLLLPTGGPGAAGGHDRRHRPDPAPQAGRQAPGHRQADRPHAKDRNGNRADQAGRGDQRMIGLSHYLVVAAILFTIGVFGIFVNRKNIIVILMSIELILLAVNINLVAFSVYLHDVTGQIFAMFVLTVAAAEAAVGLAILVTFFRNRGDIAVDDASVMKG
jgi:NADH:ubiquinone oxidoreductase subunit K/NADH:ubiquinone oxidoreductase subunit 6 (subunit J)